VTTTYAHSGNSAEHIADVFTGADEREQTARLTPQTRAFAFCETAPHAVAFTVRKRVLETVETHFAVDTHTLRGITRTSAFWKKQIRVGSPA
jgi:hypothetical protein